MRISSTSNRTIQISILAFAGFVTACPAPDSAPLVISNVTVDGAAGATQFTLFIEGRGFGLTEISYDLDTSKGEAIATTYRVQVVDQFSQVRATSSGAQVELRRPTLLVADIVLRTPLEPGIYGIELYLQAREGPPLIVSPRAFEVPGEVVDGGVGLDAGPAADTGTPPPLDTGVPPPDTGPDAGLPPPDAGPDTGLPPPDAGPDTGVPPADTGVDDSGAGDVGPGDTGPVDTGVPPDSGLGPFVGNYRYRQQIVASNQSTAAAPPNTTMRITIPHAQLSAASRAEPNGSDLAVYLGPTRLEHQWDDRAAILTDQLAIVVLFPDAVPAGPINDPPLVLYYGDPAAGVPRTDRVFAFAERFDRDLPNTWFTGGGAWSRVCGQRPPGLGQGSYCVDDEPGRVRRTLATPTVGTINANPGANVRYEVNAWINGVMGQATDLLYFAYADSNQNFVGSLQVPDPNNQFTLYPPDTQLVFVENNGQNRSVRGWRRVASQDWQRTQFRFTPTFNNPSLHFRFISEDPRDVTTVVALDDMLVRVALEPEYTPTLGPTEARAP